jgi:hypothetical protein
MKELMKKNFGGFLLRLGIFEEAIKSFFDLNFSFIHERV